MSNKEKLFTQFLSDIQESTKYLEMESLMHGYSYKIYARNAYVGVWHKGEKSFLISRYSIGNMPHLFNEYHWDQNENLGTVKPLELIEKSPLKIKSAWKYNLEETRGILDYLDDLEERNPLIEGFNSLLDRKKSAINYSTKQADKIKNYNQTANVKRENKIGINGVFQDSCRLNC